MHLGNARSALLGYLHARSLGGQFLLRIEDLDKARCRPEYVDALFLDLEYLGIEWDETPIFQSQRQDAYDDATQRLKDAGLIYPCTCSRQDVLRAASAPHGPGDDGLRYPGTCRNNPAQEKSNRAPSLRLKSLPGSTRFDDGIHGPVEQNVAETVGDFVIRRSDGVFSYQLAVVVDDAHSGITHVLRGDDLLSSTPRQIQLYQALGLPVPHFAHVPLLLGEDGKRLAKREGSFTISELRMRNVPCERVVGLLAHWSGLGKGEPADTESLTRHFTLGKILKTPTVVREAELALLG